MEIVFALLEFIIGFFGACFTLFGTLFWPLLIFLALVIILTWA